VDDADSEVNETFRLRMSAPTGGLTLGTQRQTTITIHSDEPI
jgi:hypothetical protein